ncbi:hypothetical protein [Dictyobacter arantiisoli]|uniref:Uncharacterized protein n=1 Tax=Dictyobacter arantiisoli TaxID=2014874 RepID=A0A5A5TKR2_9CHLR|nr:hypothetical protein [Dictyobacter arantiisoli]GCF11676.1 hypothetical protein KDI_52400 [Dictyobacter arantiisoli]
MNNFDELDEQVRKKLTALRKKRESNLKFRKEQRERLEKTLADPLLSPVARGNLERQLHELTIPND